MVKEELSRARSVCQYGIEPKWDKDSGITAALASLIDELIPQQRALKSASFIVAGLLADCAWRRR
jgi:hypothetical protein